MIEIMDSQSPWHKTMGKSEGILTELTIGPAISIGQEMKAQGIHQVTSLDQMVILPSQVALEPTLCNQAEVWTVALSPDAGWHRLYRLVKEDSLLLTGF